MKKCFVVCPLGSENTPTRKRSDQVLRHIIEPVCKEKRLEAVRSDKIHDTDKIDQTIIDQLASADIVIADLSEHNPNAFFELGYRTALRKPVIHIVEEGTALPFDVLGVRTIFYDLKDPDKIDSCKARLSETIDAVSLDEPVANSAAATVMPLAQQNKSNAQIMMQLLEIKDMIAQLFNSVENNNNKVVEQLISAFANQMQTAQDPRDRVAELFFKELLKNPQKAMQSLNHLSKIKFPNQP